MAKKINDVTTRNEWKIKHTTNIQQQALIELENTLQAVKLADQNDKISQLEILVQQLIDANA